MAAKNVKPIDQYLKPKESKILIQAKINESLHGKVALIMEREDRSLQEIIIACLERFADEMK